MQTLLNYMGSRMSLDTLAQAWTVKWGEPIRRMVMSGRRQFSAEEVDALFATVNSPGSSLTNALCEGWLFARQSTGVRPNYIIPEEFILAIQKRLHEVWMSYVVTRSEPPLIQQEEGTAAAGDLQTLLDYVRHHDVQLTTGGAMYKRNIQQVMEMFEVSEDLSVPEWRFGYGRRTYEYPDRLALLYDFAYDQGFLIEAPESLLRVSDLATAWQEMSRPVQVQRILRFYMRQYRRPIPRLRDIVEIIRLTTANWVTTDSVYSACEHLVNAFYYDAQSDVWTKRILQMLLHLGIIRMGRDQENSQTWFQITKLGQELLTQDESALVEERNRSQASLIVQPNFEVMVTVPDGQMEAVLAQFADLKSSGAIRIYRILERTVERGITLGYDFHAWKSMLTTCGLSPVPGNVEHLLDEWSSRYALSQSKSS